MSDSKPEGKKSSSTIDLPDAGPRRRLSKRQIIIGAGVLGVLIIAYICTAWFLSDRVPAGTTVAGISIGGMGAEEAEKTLNDSLSDITHEPLALSMEKVEVELDPEEAGMAFSAEETVDKVVGFSFSPVRIWQHIAGGAAIGPVTDVDEEALATSIKGIAEGFTQDPEDGGIEFIDAKPETTPAEEGVELDVKGAIQVIEDHWITGSRPLELPGRPIQPDISDDEVSRALDQDAKPLVSGAISVAVDDHREDFTPETLAKAASFIAEGNKLVLEIDGEMLAETLRDDIPKLEKAPQDASIKLVKNKPKITPDKSGTKIDTEQLSEDIIEASHADKRTVELSFSETEADRTKEDIEELGIEERIAEFSTPLTADPVRTNNLKIGTKAISGTIVIPGETFSLLDTLGPLTPENGYGNAPVVVNGVSKPGMAGGLSQLATTVYNASFFAGMEDVEHKPHSQYFSRYPEGREATIYSPDIDLKFRNDSEYGVMIDAGVKDGEVRVAMWSTKVWDIKSEVSDRSEVVSPTTITVSDSDCEPYSPGNPGFSVTVKRLFYQDDEEVKSESQTWRYEPQNGVKCSKDSDD